MGQQTIDVLVHGPSHPAVAERLDFPTTMQNDEQPTPSMVYNLNSRCEYLRELKNDEE